MSATVAEGSLQQAAESSEQPASTQPAATRMVPVVCPGHSRPLAELHFSPVTPDGLFLISACLDKLPMLRDGITGDWIGTFAGHKGAVWSAKLNEPATRAATGSADFTAKLWDAITGKELYSFDHKHIVKTVDFSKDGTKLLTGGMEKILRVYDLGAVDKAPIEMKNPATVRKALWHPDGNNILTGTDDGQLRLWDMRAGKIMQSISVDDDTTRIMDMEMSYDKSILTVVSGKGVAFYDMRGLAQMKRFKYDIEMEAASLHPKGHCFVAGGADMWVRLFDFKTGQELECHKGHHGPIHCLRFAPNGTAYTSGSGDATIRIWQSSKLKDASNASKAAAAGTES